MRIKIVEAMAAGKAVITTTLGTEGIATENGKNIFVADDASRFIECMEMIATNRSLYDNISSNARRFVIENYNNDVIAQRLSHFYSS